jgi:predicted nucleic acid-binding protein
MRCTLVDTGPLMGLLDERDDQRERALRTLALAPKPRLVCQPVISEVIHLLGGHPVYVARLAATFVEGTLEIAQASHWPGASKKIFSWMAKFGEHHPDFADAFLVTWHEDVPGSRVWSFDSEFRRIWRTSKGKAIRLVSEK